MKTSRYVRILNGLDPKTLQRYGRYLASPYPSQRKAQEDLFVSINQYFSTIPLQVPTAEDDEKLSQVEISSQAKAAEKLEFFNFHFQNSPEELGKTEKEKVRKINGLLSAGLNELHMFFALETALNDQDLGNQLKVQAELSELELKDQEFLFDRALKKNDLRLNHQSNEPLWTRFKGAMNQISLQLKSGQIPGIDAFAHAHNSLDMCHHTFKLYVYVGLLSVLQSFKAKEQDAVRIEIRDYLLEIAGVWKQLPTMGRCYFHACQFLDPAQTSRQTHFDSFFEEITQKEEIRKSQDSNTEEEYFEMLCIALNYLVGELNSGNESVLEKIMEIYNRLLGNQKMADRFNVPERQITNAVILLLKHGRLEDASSTLDRYINHIPKGEGRRESTRLFNEGVIAFYAKDWKLASDCMFMVKEMSKDVFFRLESRCYILKSQLERIIEHYHFNDNPELFSDAMEYHEIVFDAFRKYLASPQKVSKSHLDHYRIFMKLYTTLFRLTSIRPVKIAKLDKLASRVEHHPETVSRTWLEEKILQLRKHYTK